jgi:hypothetical protein
MEPMIVCNWDLGWSERVGGCIACIAVGHVAELVVDLQKCYVVSMVETHLGWVAAVYRQKVESIYYRMEA